MAAWTDEDRAKVIKLYTESDPTPENSTELCKEIAEKMNQSPNGVRMILSKAGVYVKKEATASGTTSKTGEKSSEGSKRVSKESQIAALKEAIEQAGKEVDEDILSKLTGKAAAYFVSILS